MTKFCDKHHMPDCPWCYTPPTPSTEELTAEIERLKKELAVYKLHEKVAQTATEAMNSNEAIEADIREMREHNESMMREGERRAMERIVRPLAEFKFRCVQFLDTRYAAENFEKAIVQFEKELGLGEEDKR